MVVLGISDPYTYDNAAALLVDGQLVAFAEEERFTRQKRAKNTVARNAVEYCLHAAGCRPKDLDEVAVSFSAPDEILRANLGQPEPGSDMGPQDWQRLTDEQRRLGSKLSALFPSSVSLRRVRHHIAHLQSAFSFCGHEEVAGLSLDGSGGEESGLLVHRTGEKLNILHAIPNARSWGMFFEAGTRHLGFRAHFDEGKVMGLASYGAANAEAWPVFDSSAPMPTLDPVQCRAFLASQPSRARGEEIRDEHIRFAAGLQRTYEEGLLGMARWLRDTTDCAHVVLSGGCALNCTANGRLAAAGIFDEVYVSPVPHDAGAALGAALWAAQERGETLNLPVQPVPIWGPGYEESDIDNAIASLNWPTHTPREFAAHVAERLAAGEIGGWFSGRLEGGPRALGSRNIIADPRTTKVRDRVNLVKAREPWRPLAPAVLLEHCATYFEEAAMSPTMAFSYRVKANRQSEVAGIVHVDGTCRPQTLGPQAPAPFRQVVQQFHKLTNIPMLLSTSFNMKDEPLVLSPADAVETFRRSTLDFLAIENRIVVRPTNAASE